MAGEELKKKSRLGFVLFSIHEYMNNFEREESFASQETLALLRAKCISLVLLESLCLFLECVCVDFLACWVAWGLDYSRTSHTH